MAACHQGIGHHPIGDQFVTGAGDFQLLALHRSDALGHDLAEKGGDTADGPALQAETGQHHQEGDDEIIPAMGQSRHHGHDGQQYRDRAAQAHPGDQGGLVAIETEGQQAQPHRQRPRHEDQDSGHQQGGGREGGKFRRRRQQAEGQEHDDLRQPGQAVLEPAHGDGRVDAGIAGHQTGHIDGEKAAAMQLAGGGEHHQRQADRRQRLQAALESHAIQREDDQPAAAQADHRPDTELGTEIGDDPHQ